MNAPLAEMLKYNRWATLRLLEDCRELEDPVLDTRPAGATGSIRELLVHLVGGQQNFALRTKGRQHEGEFGRNSAWPGWEALMEAAKSSSDELVAIAEAMDEDVEVGLPYLGKAYFFPRSFFLVHAVQHGADHRSEVRMALRAMGIETRDLDGWEYGAAMGYGREE
jgi:uncharacterized damage-inducible protein DinB